MESAALMEQLKCDTSLLSKHNLMDYSLLIFLQYDLSRIIELPKDNFPYCFVQKDMEVQLEGEPQIMNRYVCFGIIDYLTNFNLLKVMEEKIKNTYQHNPSAVHPQLYMKRFVNQCHKVVGTN